jgi:hypothetical protein
VADRREVASHEKGSSRRSPISRFDRHAVVHRSSRLYRISAIWTAAALGLAALIAASTAQAAPSAAGRSSQPAAAALPLAAPSSPSDTEATDISNLGATSGWEVQSSAVATQTGATISKPGFSTSTWLPVANDDAGAPGTELEAELQNGKCPGDTALQPVNQNTSGASARAP